MASMKNNILLFCIATLALTLFFLDQGNAAAAAAANDFVRQLCQRTQDNDLCVSEIESDLRENLKNSPNGLCEILRDRAVANAVPTTRKISDLLKTTTNQYAVQCLQICSDSYERSIMELNSTDFSVVINRYEYSGLGIGITTAYGGPKDCEDCFTERPGTSPSQLTSENQSLENMCSLILEILNLTVCNTVASC